MGFPFGSFLHSEKKLPAPLFSRVRDKRRERERETSGDKASRRTELSPASLQMGWRASSPSDPVTRGAQLEH